MVNKLILFLFFPITFFGQITKKQLDNVPPVADIVQVEPSLLTIGNKNYSLQEFTKLYKRSLLTDTTSDKSPRQFLEQFINQQLLVSKAEKDGLDTTRAFKEELATLKKELSTAFMVEKSVNDALIKEAYERLETEVNVSHILISLNENPSPADTALAYKKIIDLRNRILNGEKFSELALKYSNDHSVTKDEGNLGYITAFQTVYPFETACFNTPVGKISMPIRTKLGYHIIKVTARREYQRWKAAHIFVNIKPNSIEQDQLVAKKKIDEAYSKLQAGENFEKLVRQYSADATTNTKAGVFKRMFGTDELEKPFEETLFSLKKNNSYSTPIRTSKGWHIVRLIEKQELKPFVEMFSYLQNKVAADSRNELAKNALLVRIKKENGFKEYQSVVNDCKSLIDSVLSQKKSLNDSQFELSNKTMFSIGDKEISAKTFLKYVKQKSETAKKAYHPSMPDTWYLEFVGQENMKYEEEILDKKNQDYGQMVNEYREEILIQTLTDGHQTNLIQDTPAQKAYFEKNKELFQIPERIKLEIFEANSMENLNKFKDIFSKKIFPLSLKWQDLFFDKNSAELTENHKQHLYDLALLLLKNEDYKVEISGNIDPDENDQYSAERAQNAVKYLISKGVGIDRIVEKDNGKFQPVSKTEREKNRRISFVLSTTNKQDIVKLNNALKPESIKVYNGVFKKGENKIVDLLKWVPGEQQFEKNNRYIFANIEKIEPSRLMTFEEAKGKVLKALQLAKDKEFKDKLIALFPISVNEDLLKKVSK